MCRSCDAQAIFSRCWILCLALAGTIVIPACSARESPRPGPGTLVMQIPGPNEEAGKRCPILSSYSYFSGAYGLGLSHGIATFASWSNACDEPSLKVTGIVHGMPLPIAVSPVAWEGIPTAFQISDGRVTAIQRQYGPGPLDCLSEVPLDGSSSSHRCRPSLQVMPLVFRRDWDRVAGDIYYCGVMFSPAALALVRADSEWSRSVVDKVDTPAGTDTPQKICGGVIHDDDAIYWSTPDQVRRLSRKDGVTSVAVHLDGPLAPRGKRHAPTAMAIVGSKLLLLVSNDQGGEDWPAALYALDAHGEQRISAVVRLAEFPEPAQALAADNASAYVLTIERLLRVRLSDGHLDVLANRPRGWGMQVAVVEDLVYYMTTVVPTGNVEVRSVHK